MSCAFVMEREGGWASGSGPEQVAGRDPVVPQGPALGRVAILESRNLFHVDPCLAFYRLEHVLQAAQA